MLDIPLLSEVLPLESFSKNLVYLFLYEPHVVRRRSVRLKYF